MYETIVENQTAIDWLLETYFKDDEVKIRHDNSSAKSILTDEQVLEFASNAKNGDIFRRLMTGDITGFPSQSEADASLCGRLSFWCGNDVEQIDRIFRMSGLYREKWDEKHGRGTYGEITIEKAIQLCTEVYTLNTQYAEDLKIKQWPKLSDKALYGLAGEAVRLAARNSESDPAALLFQFLAFSGGYFGASIIFSVGDTTHYSRLNVAIIGSSSKSRKGTSAQAIRKFFNVDKDPLRITPGPLSSGEGIIYAARDEHKEYTCTNKNKQTYKYIIKDPGVKDKRLLVLDEELASALASMKREGNKLSTIIRTLFDSGNCDPLTKTSKISCTGAHVSIITHCTISELAAKLEDNEHVNGFANRFLWVVVRRQKIVSRALSMPEEEVMSVRERIKKAYECSRTIQEISFDEGAWELWDAVYPELSKDYTGFAGAVINRAEVHVMRLSMIYALLDCSKTIKRVHLEAALAAWEYCKNSALYLFGDREEDTLTQKILDILENGPKTATEIYKALYGHTKAKNIKASLDDLIARERVQAVQEKTEGRTKITFSLCTSSKSVKSTLSPEQSVPFTQNTLIPRRRKKPQS
jgi:hypothetical protein